MGKKKGGGGGGGAVEEKDVTAPFLKAIKGGDLMKVEKFLDKDEGLSNASNKKGQTSVMIAIEERCSDIVETLLESGAKVNQRDPKGLCELHYCVYEEDDLSTVKLIRAGAKLNNKDNDGDTPLHLAARLATEGSQAIAKLMLSPDQHDESDESCESDEDEPAPKRKIFQISESHISESLKTTNSDGANVLHYAAAEPDCRDLALFLIEKADKLNIKNFLDSQSSGGSPLANACSIGNIDVAEKLMLAGCRVDSTSEDGRTPLHEVAMDGSVKLLDAIFEINKTAEYVNKRSGDGSTALHHAAMNGHLPVVVKILEIEGIENNVQDSEGCTPMSLAWEQGHKSIISRLEEEGISTEGLDVEVQERKSVREPILAPSKAEEVERKFQAKLARDRLAKEQAAKEKKIQEKMVENKIKAAEEKRDEPARYELNSATVILFLYVHIIYIYYY